ncbi:MAG: multifunctional CCA addition/repair protein [Pseudomonadota bacterium]
MDVYLVGGAVRDELLGLDVVERDWVVVGSTPAAMEAAGYRPVGKDFPVFLHPETNEEYALARTERKSGVGYHGFTFHTGPDVSLEDDLVRRDLTINAMARRTSGELVDPHAGQADIDARLLRHVSPAFAEDPVRVLRLARFAARFAALGFQVAPETVELAQQMVAAGEIDHLQADRVWKETERALAGPRPRVFFEVLRETGALARVFPEIDRLYGVPQPAKHHPEIDTGLHAMLVLDAAAELSPDVAVRFAALAHDLGKGLTPPDQWPSHHGHEQTSARVVGELAERLPLPRAVRDLAIIVAREHGRVHKALELRPGTVLNVLNAIDVWRRPERLDAVLAACEADSRGRTGFEDAAYPASDYLRACYAAARAVSTDALIADGFSGQALGDELARRRQAAIAVVKRQYAD